MVQWLTSGKTWVWSLRTNGASIAVQPLDPQGQRDWDRGFLDHTGHSSQVKLQLPWETLSQKRRAVEEDTKSLSLLQHMYACKHPLPPSTHTHTQSLRDKNLYAFPYVPMWWLVITMKFSRFYFSGNLRCLSQFSCILAEETRFLDKWRWIACYW